MRSLFLELGWWWKALLAGGFGLMTGFGSAVLPAPWQALGFSIGTLMFLSACVGSVLHGINTWRDKLGKPRVQLDPYIVPAGLALILIGAALVGYGSWQGYGLNRIATPPTSANSGSATVSASAPKAILDPEAARRRLSALEQIADVIRGPVSEAHDFGLSFSNTWPTVYILNAYQNKYHAAFRTLKSAVDRQSDYPEIVSLTNWDPPYEVEPSVDAYAAALSMFDQNSVLGSPRQALRKPQMDFYQGVQKLTTWLQTARSKITEKRAQYEQAMGTRK
jgi:hypothetical protein